MTRAQAAATLHRLAVGVALRELAGAVLHEPDEGTAVSRLLERVAAAGQPELQAALLEAGARALIRATEAGTFEALKVAKP